MKANFTLFSLVVAFFIYSCGQTEAAPGKPLVPPAGSYKIVDSSGQDTYQVFIKDTSLASIQKVNDFLKDSLQLGGIYCAIYYFDNEQVAQTYWEQVVGGKASEKESDKLYKNLIAIYRSNPNSNFEKLERAH